MTRRALTLAAPAVLLAQAQQPTVRGPQAPQAPGQELDAAREGQRRSASELAKVPLAMAVEPACHFKA